VIELAEEVREARAVVALETTLIAHGFPPGEGTAVGLEAERAVRDAGAAPATIGVLDGKIRVGLSADELGRFDESARKAGRLCRNRRRVGAQQRDGDFRIGNPRGAGNALGCGRIQRLSVMFTDDEYLVH